MQAVRESREDREGRSPSGPPRNRQGGLLRPTPVSGDHEVSEPDRKKVAQLHLEVLARQPQTKLAGRAHQGFIPVR